MPRGGAAAAALRHDEPSTRPRSAPAGAEALRAQIVARARAHAPRLEPRARPPRLRLRSLPPRLRPCLRRAAPVRDAAPARRRRARRHVRRRAETRTSRTSRASSRALGIETYDGDPERSEKLLASSAAPPLDLAGLLAETDYDVALLSLWYLAAALPPRACAGTRRARGSSSTRSTSTSSARSARPRSPATTSSPARRPTRRRASSSVYAAADALVAVTESDREALLRGAARRRTSTSFSNIHDVTDAPRRPDGRDGLLFVGNFLHHAERRRGRLPPRRDAAARLGRGARARS